jgi:hypothetical protein
LWETRKVHFEDDMKTYVLLGTGIYVGIDGGKQGKPMTVITLDNLEYERQCGPNLGEIWVWRGDSEASELPFLKSSGTK